MPLSGRARFALFGLIGVFLIPIYFSSLNGLTHVLTCRQKSEAPFTIAIPAQGPPTVLSATTVTRGSTGLCGGLVLDMGVSTAGAGHIRVVLPISNTTRYTWRGTVKLALGHTTVPVGIGAIRPGATRSSRIEVKVPAGTTELAGSVLFGP